MSDSLFEDPVVAEIHAIRAEMLAECEGDLHVLLDRVKACQRASGRKVRSAPAKPPPPAGQGAPDTDHAVDDGRAGNAAIRE